ncbi:hypothetical protein MP228_005473 [Amoeboaphelidium protococcarum]|nr:hypothetical protein MP228_005473 [Amoeboaphelidium protococcarum]
MAAQFLDSLRQFQLETYYVQLITAGITSVRVLQQMPVEALARITSCAEDDKLKFQLLINTSKSMAGGSQSNLTAQISTTAQRDKRLSSRSSSAHSLAASDRSLNQGLSIGSQGRRMSVGQLDAYGVPVGKSSGNNNNRSGSKLNLSSNAKQQTSTGTEFNDRIRVCVRKRPLNRKELARQERDIAEVVSSKTVVVHEPKTKVDLTRYIEKHQFIFDEVFDSNCSNEDIYQRTAQPLIETVFNGGKATCFAYGQTGSGKSFTMLDQSRGLYALACRDIFTMLRSQEYSNFHAEISFYEIYQGQLYDLLNGRQRIHAREDGNQNVVIQGITEFPVSSQQELMDIFQKGSEERSVGKTGANSDSSRSHAILQISIKTLKQKVIGKFSFIDLAGSERGADRGETDSKTRMEGSEINKSLLALKECIRALDQDSKHTPFRQSKLTQVLKDSFVGNSRTCMIATISPNSGNSEHSLNTLRYADRVKELKSEDAASQYNSNNASTSPAASSSHTAQQYEQSNYYQKPPVMNMPPGNRLVPDVSNPHVFDTKMSPGRYGGLLEQEQLPDVSMTAAVLSDEEKSFEMQKLKSVKQEILTDLNYQTGGGDGGNVKSKSSGKMVSSSSQQRWSFQKKSIEVVSPPNRSQPNQAANRSSQNAAAIGNRSSRIPKGSQHKNNDSPSEGDFTAANQTFSEFGQQQFTQVTVRNNQKKRSGMKSQSPDSQSPTSPSTSVQSEPLNYARVNDFIRAHRRQIRETVDTSKQETLLLSNLAQYGFHTISSSSIGASNTDLYRNSNPDLSTMPQSEDAELNPEMRRAFIDYAFALDKHLERKYRSIVQLRQQVRNMILDAGQSQP